MKNPSNPRSFESCGKIAARRKTSAPEVYMNISLFPLPSGWNSGTWEYMAFINLTG